MNGTTARARGRMVRLGRIFAVGMAAVAGAELVGQGGYYAVRGYPVFAARDAPFHQRALFEPHPYLAGRLRAGLSIQSAGKTITTTRTHTRWTGAPDTATTRVAVLGGSTTFGTRVSDADSWPALLQAELGPGYAVENHGVPGYSSTEAVIQVALILPETHSDVVVFYGGWNDLRNYHRPDAEPDGWSAGMEQYATLGLPIPPTAVSEDLAGGLARVSFLARAVGGAARCLELGKAAVPVPSREPDPRVDRLYARNLRTLKALAWRDGAAVLFLPQTLNDADFAGGTTGRPWSPRIVDDAMPGLMARFNGVMRDVAGSGETPLGRCAYADGVTSASWGPGDFADDGHLNRAGGLKLAGIVAAEIRCVPGAPGRGPP